MLCALSLQSTASMLLHFKPKSQQTPPGTKTKSVKQNPINSAVKQNTKSLLKLPILMVKPFLFYNNQTALIKELNFDGWDIGLQPALGKRRNDCYYKLEPCHLNFAAIKVVTLLEKRIVIFV